MRLCWAGGTCASTMPIPAAKMAKWMHVLIVWLARRTRIQSERLAMQCAIRKGHPFEGQLCSKEQRICSLARSMEVGERLWPDSGLVHSLIEVHANHVGRGRRNATPALPHFSVKPVAPGAADGARCQFVHLVIAKTHSRAEPRGARPSTAWLPSPGPTVPGAPPSGPCPP